MIRLGNRLFSPPWWATALFVLVGAVMLLLGRWQLQRAAEKISLATAAQQALSAAPADMLEVLSGSAGQAPAVVNAGQRSSGNDTVARHSRAASADYRQVTASGTLLVGQQFLWDNRVHKGSAGFEIIIPLKLAGTDRIVLLNRGWVPVGISRDDLPDTDFAAGVAGAMQNAENSPAAPVIAISVEGLLTEPSRGFASGPALAAQRPDGGDESAWPKLLQYFDYQAISDALQAPVVAGVIQHIDEDSISYGLAELDGFLKTDNWQAVANGPEKHYGYAFQWFGMFLALLAIYFITNSRKIGRKIKS